MTIEEELKHWPHEFWGLNVYWSYLLNDFLNIIFIKYGHISNFWGKHKLSFLKQIEMLVKQEYREIQLCIYCAYLTYSACRFLIFFFFYSGYCIRWIEYSIPIGG